MLTKLGIVWAIVEILLGCQMIYYAFAQSTKVYMVIVTLYWLWFVLYAWNPFNVFYTKNEEK